MYISWKEWKRKKNRENEKKIKIKRELEKEGKTTVSWKQDKKKMEFFVSVAWYIFQNYSNKTRYVKEPHSLSTSNHLNSLSQSPVLLSELWKRSIRFHCVIISVVTGEKLSYENTVLDKLNVLISLEWLSFMSYWVRFESIKLIIFKAVSCLILDQEIFFVWLYLQFYFLFLLC